VIVMSDEDGDQSEAGVLKFFRDRARDGCEALYLLPPANPSDLDSQYQAMRVYLDGMNKRPDGTWGRSIADDVATEADCREKAWQAQRDGERRAEEEHTGANLVDDPNDARQRAETKVEKKRWEKLLAVEAREKELSEMSTHAYLATHIVPDLNGCLIALSGLKPENPVDYLAHALEQRLPGK